MRIIVLGAGAWGTALTIHLAKRYDVMLWARKHSQREEMKSKRENSQYLPNFKLPLNVCIADNLNTIDSFIDGGNALFMIASPMAGFINALQSLQPYLPKNACLVWLSKGILLGQDRKDLSGNYQCLLKNPHNNLSATNKKRHFESVPEIFETKFAHQLVHHYLPECRNYGALMGPSFAAEVARGLPTTLTIASPSSICRNLIVDAIHYDQLRIYKSKDIIGVEIGGAVKNIIAIAVGISDGLYLGMNARAALITRGLHEIIQLGKVLGAKISTFYGLTGLGDLVLTSTGNLSRNRQVGLLLAEGKAISEIISSLGHVAEGVACVRAVRLLANRHKIDMPITDAVYRIMFEQTKPEVVLSELLSRKTKSEQ